MQVIELLKSLGKKNVAEVTKLCEDIKNSLHFNKIDVNVLDNNKVQVVAKEKFDRFICDMDFSLGKIVHTLTKKRFGSGLLPSKEETQVIRGTIGGKINEVVTHTKRQSVDKKHFYECTDYKNYVTGNMYKREKTHKGTNYYKLVNGLYINLFK